MEQSKAERRGLIFNKTFISIRPVLYQSKPMAQKKLPHTSRQKGMEEVLTQPMTSIMEASNSLAIVHITQCMFLKYIHIRTHRHAHARAVLICSILSTKSRLVLKH